MKKILITGAAGSLGIALRKQFAVNPLYQDKYLIVLTGTKEVKEEHIQKLDITDAEMTFQMIQKEQPDYIINCAAYTAVDLCEDDEEQAYLVNAKGPENLARAAAEIGAVLFHISTDYVFDGSSETPYKETDVTHPISAYGRTKVQGEKLVRKACSNSFILRTAWIYGAKKSFVSTMLRLANQGGPLRVVCDQFGSPTSADELAKAILFLLPSKQFGTINVTCEGVASWYEFAKYIFELTEKDVEVISVTSDEFKSKAPRPKYSKLSLAKLEQDYGYQMPHWKEALKSYLQDYDK